MSVDATSTDEETTAIDNIGDERPSRRKSDYRNIAALAASIAVEGLRHPILLMPNGQLLKGGRRLAAARTLGWTEIPSRHVTYIEEAVDALYDMRDEHTEPRSVEESVALGLTVETLDHRDKGPKNDYTQIIGGAVARSGSSYKRARAIVMAAHSQLRPMHVVDVAKQALAAVDAGTMTVTTAYNRLKAAEKANVADVVSDDGLPAAPPPAAEARSPRARKLREEWIRALASKGATSEQIAARLCIGTSAVKKICKDIGVTPQGDVVTVRTQRRQADPNKAMRVAVDDLDALLWSLDRVDVTMLDPGDAVEWAVALAGYARGLSRISRTIKGVVK